jgi:2-polyprenyl-3-methyl-5-hydroxy-6-metoxy-1,4-benzoquinol methylase
MNETAKPPAPDLFMDAVWAFVRSSAIKSAIELDVFTHIDAGADTAAAMAAKCGAAERGMRILCDALTVMGFLDKKQGRYRLTRDSATFLSRKSPAFMGDTVGFLQAPHMLAAFADLSNAVKNGGHALTEKGNTETEAAAWVDFARSMGGLQRPVAAELAAMIEKQPDEAFQVLDVAAGHGVYGITVAQRFPKAKIAALDWEPVLAVARENAAKAGILGRFKTIGGDAFRVRLGGPYDVVLLPNFLHHFSAKQCTTFLKRVEKALKDDGVVLTFEHMPEDDRTAPAPAVMFALTMLATTPEGDAYTVAEYRKMFADAGISRTEVRNLSVARGRALVSRK